MEERIIHTMGINNCGGRCIINAHVVDGKIIRITTDTSEGTLKNPPLKACARGLNYHKTYLNPETRLKCPLLRTGERGSGKFRKVSWEEAISYITREWIRIRDTYGPESRYVNYGWGVSALVTPLGMIKRLLALDGGYLDYYNSYSTACINYTLPYIYGTKYAGNSLEELCNSKLIILWGHNPAETRFDTCMFYLREAKKRGIPIICVDPRYHDTARLLDAEWIPLKPTTDAAFFDAMAYVIITNGLYDKHFIETYCQGFTHETMPYGYQDEEDYFSYVLGKRDGCPKTPGWAEEITGVPAKIIESLAVRYATTKPAALIQGYGAQRNANGEQTVRGSIMLACLTGNVGISGGWSGASHTVVNPPAPHMPKVENPYKAQIPVFCWTKAIEDGVHMGKEDGVKGVDHLKSNIKMIFNLAGNMLINQHSDINKTMEILKDTTKCECIVCSDLFMTPSAKFADIILPGISFLEMNNITTPWEIGNFIGYNNKVVEPYAEGKCEYDWIKEIARNIGLYDEFTEGHETVDDWLESRYNVLRKEVPYLPTYEEFQKAGIYRYQNWPSHVAFSEQIQDMENHPFQTPSGKIEIFSTQLFDLGQHEKIPGIPKYVEAIDGPADECRKKYPLQLIGYHTKRRCHSIHDNNPDMELLDPQMVHMHIEDADQRDIKNGQMVRIYNDRGCIMMKARVSNHIMKGVVAIAQGAWYTPDKNGVDRRGNVNILTSLTPTPLAKGNPQHTNLVQIEPVTENFNDLNE